MNRTTIYCGRDRLNLTDELKLCDYVNALSNKENLPKVGKLLGLESKTFYDIPNNCWNMADIETEAGKLMQAKRIFKVFSNKIAYLICPEHPTFHQRDDAQGITVYQSLK